MWEKPSFEIIEVGSEVTGYIYTEESKKRMSLLDDRGVDSNSIADKACADTGFSEKQSQ